MIYANKVYVAGEVVDGPELVEIGRDRKIAQALLEVRFTSKAPLSDRTEKSCFRIVATASRAEKFQRDIQRGDNIMILGRLRHEVWHTPEGQKRDAVKIVMETWGRFVDDDAEAIEDDDVGAPVTVQSIEPKSQVVDGAA